MLGLARLCDGRRSNCTAQWGGGFPARFLFAVLLVADFQSLSQSRFLLAFGFALSSAVCSCLFIPLLLVISPPPPQNTHTIFLNSFFFFLLSSAPGASSQEAPVLFVLY